MSDFADSYASLRAAVLDACGNYGEWPARVAAGIYAVLDFAIADPSAARALTIDVQPARTHDDPYPRMIDNFCDLLAAVAPAEQRLHAPNDEALIGGIATVIADHLRRDRLDGLEDIGPDLVYMALLPYLGFAEAKRWAQTVGQSRVSGTYKTR